MRKRIYILGSLIDKVDLNEALKKIEIFIKEGKPRHIITANAEIIYKGINDKRLSRTLNKADLVTADGAGVVWASSYLDNPLQERVTGIDLLHKVCAEAQKQGWTMYFLGAAPGVAEKAVLKVLELYPASQIAGYENGYFSEDEEPKIIEKIKSAKPEILFVAMGAPKQEFWIREHLQELEVTHFLFPLSWLSGVLP